MSVQMRTMLDVADKGARLRISGTIENLKLKEFFLVLSSTGAAYRHCGLSWVNGSEIGVHFLAKDETSKMPTVRSRNVDVSGIE